MKKMLLPFIVGALALSLAACGGEDKDKDKSNEAFQSKLAEQQVDNEQVVAIVNDEELIGEQYNAVLTTIQNQMQQMGQDPTNKELVEQIKKQVLDTVVNQTLLLQKAKSTNVEASEAEIDEEYTALAAQYGDEDKLKEVLDDQKISIESFREQIAESIIYDKYRDQVAPLKEVTDEEIKAYYDKIAEQAKDSELELPSLEEASEEIKGILEQEEQRKKLVEHVEELKEQAKIELKI